MSGPAAPRPSSRLGSRSPELRRGLLRGLIVAALLCVLLVAVRRLVPQYPRSERTSACRANLQRLIGIWGRCAADPSWRPRHGTALLLGWRRSRDLLPEGAESVLLCPGDQLAVIPSDARLRARYDEVDLDRPPHDLCSYSVRDFSRFPVAPGRADEEPILACLGRGTGPAHVDFHRDAYLIAFADGDVRIFDRNDLGLTAGTAPVIGPGSQTPYFHLFLPLPLTGPDDGR